MVTNYKPEIHPHRGQQPYSKVCWGHAVNARKRAEVRARRWFGRLYLPPKIISKMILLTAGRVQARRPTPLSTDLDETFPKATVFVVRVRLGSARLGSEVDRGVC